MEELPLQSLMIKRNDRMPTPHKTFEKVLSKLIEDYSWLDIDHYGEEEEDGCAIARRHNRNIKTVAIKAFEAGKKAWYEEIKFIPIDPALEVIKNDGITIMPMQIMQSKNIQPLPKKKWEQYLINKHQAEIQSIFAELDKNTVGGLPITNEALNFVWSKTHGNVVLIDNKEYQALKFKYLSPKDAKVDGARGAIPETPLLPPQDVAQAKQRTQYKKPMGCPYKVNHFERSGICNLCGLPKKDHYYQEGELHPQDAKT